jgi:hypothetical protein
MKKPKPKKATDTTFKFRCHTADLEAFRIATEAAGLNGNLTAWILQTLRKAAREQTKS